MDRREALKKLSAGGAIAAGGSMVLSSTKVAYAMSGPPPTGAVFTIGPGASSSLAVVSVTFPSAPAGCTETGYSWTLVNWSVSQGNSASISVIGSTSNSTLSLSKSKHGWGSGDWVEVLVTVSWSCGGDVSYSSGRLNYP